MVNPPASKVLHKKASLAVLSDERNAGLFDREAAALVRACIPWTRVVEERHTEHHGEAVDLVPHVLAHRERLVLKPNDEHLLLEEVQQCIRKGGGTRQFFEVPLHGEAYSVEAITQAQIVGAELRNKEARVTLKLISEQTSVTEDASGNVSEGDAAHVDSIIDIWTFARDTGARDPNWQLVQTDQPS